MIALFIVGFLVWFPTILLASFTGPWFMGWEVVSATALILALLVPGLANLRPGSAGGSLVAWTIALAPLLAILGTLAQFLLKRAMIGNTASDFLQGVSSLLVVACCIGVGLLIHRSLKPGPAGTATGSPEDNAQT